MATNLDQAILDYFRAQQGGSDYNPGAGAGVYRRSEDNTTWVHLG